jgi:O-antigen/teichoic acid export membrane protein
MLAILFFFSSDVIQLVGGEQYVPYSFIVKGMVFLYVFIFLGYPIRIAIRILVLNKVFFTGYLLSFVFSLITFYFLLSEFEMNGAIIGLISAQVVTLGYWQFVLKKHNFILWK